ncbi:hypothetical protein [Erythrobacter sp.]|uniref:hypothetical protein n=1 Tax=Erythrobacter sp. TaxID=1042 RepID=UPI0031204278
MIDRKTFVIPLLLTALAGCAGSGSGSGKYPSLAIRDIERVQGTFEPVGAEQLDVPKVEVAYSGSLQDRLSALVGQAEDAHRVFNAAVPVAEQLANAANDAEIGSDAWASAQVALAGLDSARSDVAVALGELDILHAARAVQAEDVGAIDAARGKVLALVTIEDATLERLREHVR